MHLTRTYIAFLGTDFSCTLATWDSVAASVFVSAWAITIAAFSSCRRTHGRVLYNIIYAAKLNRVGPGIEERSFEIKLPKLCFYTAKASYICCKRGFLGYLL